VAHGEARASTLTLYYYAKEVSVALPLYPELKAKLEEWFIEVMREAAQRQLGPFNQSPRFIQHEGRDHRYTTVTGEARSAEYQDFAVQFRLGPAELASMTIEQVLRLFHEKGTEIGTLEARYHFGRLDSITEETGNIIHGNGAPLSIDMIIEALEQMYIAFDRSGNPRMPTIVVHPTRRERLREILSEAETDPDTRARLSAVFERKRREWHEQESSRKLVD
jgi:hypothetical protein